MCRGSEASRWQVGSFPWGPLAFSFRFTSGDLKSQPRAKPRHQRAGRRPSTLPRGGGPVTDVAETSPGRERRAQALAAPGGPADVSSGSRRPALSGRVYFLGYDKLCCPEPRGPRTSSAEQNQQRRGPGTRAACAWGWFGPDQAEPGQPVHVRPGELAAGPTGNLLVSLLDMFPIRWGFLQLVRTSHILF